MHKSAAKTPFKKFTQKISHIHSVWAHITVFIMQPLNNSEILFHWFQIVNYAVVFSASSYQCSNNDPNHNSF